MVSQRLSRASRETEIMFGPFGPYKRQVMNHGNISIRRKLNSSIASIACIKDTQDTIATKYNISAQNRFPQTFYNGAIRNCIQQDFIKTDLYKPLNLGGYE